MSLSLWVAASGGQWPVRVWYRIRSVKKHTRTLSPALPMLIRAALVSSKSLSALWRLPCHSSLGFVFGNAKLQRFRSTTHMCTTSLAPRREQNNYSAHDAICLHCQFTVHKQKQRGLLKHADIINKGTFFTTEFLYLSNHGRPATPQLFAERLHQILKWK